MSLGSYVFSGSSMNFTAHNHAHLERFLQNLAKKPVVTSQSPTSTQFLEIKKDNYKYTENYKFPYINEVNKYEKMGKIGHGTFGEVFKGRDRKNTEKLVALKKILMENETEGFPITGKSLSEAVILASTNPKYDNRLFIDLPVQYIKTTSSEHVFCFCFDIQNNLPLTLCEVHTF